MTEACNETISGCVFEDSAFTVLQRVQVNGADWTQAQVSSITYKVWNTTDPVTPVASGSVTVASSVFDTLQLDGRWPLDEEGYNFRHTLAATVLTESGTYRVEYKVTLASGSVFHLAPSEPIAQAIWGS